MSEIKLIGQAVLRLTEKISWRNALRRAREIIARSALAKDQIIALLGDSGQPDCVRVALLERLQYMYIRDASLVLTGDHLAALRRSVAGMSADALFACGTLLKDNNFFKTLAGALLAGDAQSKRALVRIVAASSHVSRDEHTLTHLYYLLDSDTRKDAARLWPPIAATKKDRELLAAKLPPIERAKCWMAWNDIESEEVLAPLPSLLRGMAIIGRYPDDTEKGVKWLLEIPDDDLVWLFKNVSKPIPNEAFKMLIEALIENGRIYTAQRCMLTHPVFLDLSREICEAQNLQECKNAILAAIEARQGNVVGAMNHLLSIEDRELARHAIQYCERISYRAKDTMAKHIVENADALPREFVEDFMKIHTARSGFDRAVAALVKARRGEVRESLSEAIKAIRATASSPSLDTAGMQLQNRLFDKALKECSLDFVGKGVLTPRQECSLLEKQSTWRVILLGMLAGASQEGLAMWLNKQKSPWVKFFASALWPPNFHTVRVNGLNFPALAGYSLMLYFPVPLVVMAAKFIAREVKSFSSLQSNLQEMRRHTLAHRLYMPSERAENVKNQGYGR